VGALLRTGRGCFRDAAVLACLACPERYLRPSQACAKRFALGWRHHR
jgi:hypothetical protein